MAYMEQVSVNCQHRFASILEVLMRPAVFIENTEQLCDAVDTIITPDLSSIAVLIHIISACNEDYHSNVQLDKLTLLRDEFHRLFGQVDCCVVTSGLDKDIIAHTCGHAARWIEEERQHRLQRSEYSREHEGDLSTNHSTVVLLGVNSQAIVQSSSLFPTLNGSCAADSSADGWHTHFILMNDSDCPIDDWEARRFKVIDRAFHRLERFGKAANTADSDSSRYVQFPLEREGTVSSCQSATVVDKQPLMVVAFFAGDADGLRAVQRHASNGSSIVIFEEFSEIAFAFGNLIRKFDAIKDAEAAISASIIERRFGVEIKNIMKELLKYQNCFYVIRTLKIGALVNTIAEALKFSAIRARSVPQLLHSVKTIIKLNCADCLLEPLRILDPSNCANLFEEALKDCDRIEVVRAFLKHGLSFAAFVTFDRLWRLFSESEGQDFFQSVILGRMLGYANFPHDAKKFLRMDVGELLYRLTGIKMLRFLIHDLEGLRL